GKTDSSELVKPKAYVILNEGVKASDELAEELIEYVRENMAGYKRPRWIEFVAELPRTATGKIQRFKLRE
ncbi:MAG: benzoate-CoA ligase family protein, partial [Chloroflexota bacterium]